MLVIPPGSVKLGRSSHPENAKAPMSVTLSGSGMSERDVQLRNAARPMRVSPFGSEIFVRDGQL